MNLCTCAKSLKGKLIGEGKAGQVYNWNLPSESLSVCPRCKKLCVIKEEVLPSSFKKETHEKLKEIENAMSKAGVSPRVYANFICDTKDQLIRYTLMQAIQGENLRKKRQILDSHQCNQLYEKIKKMHDLNIIHHDLWLGNIMLDEKGEPWLIDWEKAIHEKEDDADKRLDDLEDLAQDLPECHAAYSAYRKFLKPNHRFYS